MSDETPLFWKRSPVVEAGALVDGENYFRAFYHSALAARRYILIVGWQFELETQLLRGTEATQAAFPVSFWSFLRALCEREERLQVYILAWDYSLVYVLERQWLQAARAKLMGHPRMHMEFRRHPDVLGSHHQKFVVIDEKVAFAGGIDFCESRWDTRAHDLCNELRQNVIGLRSKPYHDIQAAVTGPVVSVFTELFESAWLAVVGQRPPLPALEDTTSPTPKLEALLETEFSPLPARDLVLCRTLPETESAPATCELQRSYEHLIRNAQHLIYIETQYFTSSAIGNVLTERMSDTRRPKLAIIIMMPNGAESHKEHLVLGARQEHTLSMLCSTAKRYGHELRMFYVAAETADGQRVMTYIHSKLMIVDDARLTFGSANLTNRSMSFDSELNLVWNLCSPGEPEKTIRDLRASLIAEHVGRRDASRFSDPATLIRQLDDELARPGSKLQNLPVSTPTHDDDPLWTAVFDPSTELWSESCQELAGHGPNELSNDRTRRWHRTTRLILYLANAAFRNSRSTNARKSLRTNATTPTDSEGRDSPRVLGLKFLLGLALLYGLVAFLGKAFAEPLQGLGREFAEVLGLPGFALGTFLADGLHFPIPPQFYMLLTVALNRSAGWSLFSIALGSLLGGAVGFLIARKVSRWEWLERRFARLRLERFIELMQRHPYRWVAIASLTPIAFSWLCYLAGFHRFSNRAFLLLCLLRIPKLVIYFAIVRAGWTSMLP